MRILIKILIIFLIILGIFFMVYSFLQSTDNLDIIQNVIENNVSDESLASKVVKVYDGKIEAENLLDEFMERDLSEKITFTINEYEGKDRVNYKELTFVPGNLNEENDDESSENTSNVEIGSFDEFKDAYGYYVWTVNGEVVHEKLYNMDYNLERKTENGIVKVRLYDFVEKHEVELFSYTLESSNYTSKYDLNYNQRKDMGIEKIVDGEKFDVYEFGGDVSFTVGTDMVYTFEKAIEDGIITIDGILEQAKLDSRYGICEEGYYSDGGSVEYCYPDYTILKLSTEDGNNDMVIGFSGQIINQFNREFKKLNDNKLINESVKTIE